MGNSIKGLIGIVFNDFLPNNEIYKLSNYIIVVHHYPSFQFKDEFVKRLTLHSISFVFWHTIPLIPTLSPTCTSLPLLPPAPPLSHCHSYALPSLFRIICSSRHILKVTPKCWTQVVIVRSYCDLQKFFNFIRKSYFSSYARGNKAKSFSHKLWIVEPRTAHLPQFLWPDCFNIDCFVFTLSVLKNCNLHASVGKINLYNILNFFYRLTKMAIFFACNAGVKPLLSNQSRMRIRSHLHTRSSLWLKILDAASTMFVERDFTVTDWYL